MCLHASLLFKYESNYNFTPGKTAVKKAYKSCITKHEHAKQERMLKDWTP